jgi:hypothetical protein
MGTQLPQERPPFPWLFFTPPSENKSGKGRCGFCFFGCFFFLWYWDLNLEPTP